MSELLFRIAYESKFVETLLLAHVCALAHMPALGLFLLLLSPVAGSLLLRVVCALRHYHPLGFFLFPLFFSSIIHIQFVASFCWKLFVRWRTNILQNSFRLFCSLDLSFAYDLTRPSAGSCLCAVT